jgi:hypothetical protein
LLRILYTSMLSVDCSTESSLQNSEALLEQACALAPLHVCTRIAEALEHTALSQLHCSARGLAHVAEQSDMGAYRAWDGVPCSSPSDVMLLLLLFRSSAVASSLGRGGGGGGGAHLPAPSATRLAGGGGITVASSSGHQVPEEGEGHFYTCCRACFVLLLCCAVNLHAAAGADERCGGDSPHCDFRQLLGDVVIKGGDGRSGSSHLETISLADYCEDVIRSCLGRSNMSSTTQSQQADYSSSSSSSSSSCSSSGASWVVSARAQDLISFLLHLTVHRAIAHPCVAAMLHMTGGGGPAEGGRRSGIGARGDDVIVEQAGQIVLTACLGAIFDSIRDSEATILTSLLSTIVAFSSAGQVDHGSIMKGGKTSSKRRSDDVSSPLHLQSSNSTPVHALTQTFHSLIRRHKQKALGHTPLLHSYIATLTLLRLPDASKALAPLALLSGDCRLLFGALLTYYRKSLLHRDADKRTFAIVSLIDLLAMVGESAQLEIVQILLHVLVMPLPFRCVLYSTLQARLQAGAALAWRDGVSSRALHLLLDKLTRHINAILYGNEDWSDDYYDHIGAGGGEQERLSLHSCVDVVVTSSGATATFKEDVQVILELIASLEMFITFNRLSSLDFRLEDKKENVVAAFHGLIFLFIPSPKQQCGQQTAGENIDFCFLLVCVLYCVFNNHFFS